MPRDETARPCARICLQNDLPDALRKKLLCWFTTIQNMTDDLAGLGCDVEVTAHLSGREVLFYQRGPEPSGPTWIKS